MIFDALFFFLIYGFRYFFVYLLCPVLSRRTGFIIGYTAIFFFFSADWVVHLEAHRVVGITAVGCAR